MAKRKDVPKTGVLQNVRVVHSSISVAGPFCASLMADMGADVIWIENPRGPDISRGGSGNTAQQDRRNMRNLSMNISAGEGKTAFLKLLEETDIFIEASKPGQYEKWGLTDEIMWQANPRLIIVHISGFGQFGDSSYYPRASYDPIAQAFGGLMYVNSTPEEKATPANFLVGDYYAGYMGAFAALAAYIRMKETGVGDSIDVAQYEAVIRCGSTYTLDNWNLGQKFDRVNNRNGAAGTAGYNSYVCKDGIEVYMLILGPGVVKAALPIFGLPYGTDEFPEMSPMFRCGTPAGDKVEAAVSEYCARHTAQEVEDTLCAAGIPCSQIMTHEMMPKHPHYKARNSLMTWEKVDGEEFIGTNIFPRLTKNPGEIWRGCPTIGMDNEDILKDLGYNEEKIKKMYEQGIVAKRG